MEVSTAELMVCVVGAVLVGKFLGWEPEPEYYNLEEYDDDDGCK